MKPHSQSQSLSVIIPIHNEEQLLRSALNRFAEEFDHLIFPCRWHYVLVENGSRDHSRAIIREYVNALPLFLDEPDYGGALREGILTATGTWSLVLNIDHVWDPVFMQWAWKCRERYDLILGSKRSDPTLNSQRWHRVLLSSGLNFLLRSVFRFNGTDTHGLKLFRTERMREIARACVMRRGQFDTEMTLRACRQGCRIAECPVIYGEKRPPRNSMARKVSQNCIDIIRLVRVMRGVPSVSQIRYDRIPRSALISENCPCERSV
jgi:glycosyltransferase involved in cell wall biosynthesis